MLSIFWNNKNTKLPGNSIAEVCRKYSISRSNFDKWRQKFKGMSS
ncbi:transposase [Thermodesulfovibrio hydrogeniphilus]